MIELNFMPEDISDINGKKLITSKEIEYFFNCEFGKINKDCLYLIIAFVSNPTVDSKSNFIFKEGDYFFRIGGTMAKIRKDSKRIFKKYEKYVCKKH